MMTFLTLGPFPAQSPLVGSYLADPFLNETSGYVVRRLFADHPFAFTVEMSTDG